MRPGATERKTRNAFESGTDMPKTDLPVYWLGLRHKLSTTQTHNTAYSADGRIWAATPTGLFCYDGVATHCFDQKHGLSSHGLRSVTVDSQNRLWIGSDTGLDVLDISCAIPKVIDRQPFGTVDAITILSDGRALIGAPHGLYSTTIGEMPRKLKANWPTDTTITATHLDTDSIPWILGPDIGFAFYMSEKWISLKAKGLDDIGIPTCITGGEGKKVIIGGTEGIAIVSKDGIPIIFKTKAPVTALLFCDGFIWSGEGNALRRIIIYPDKCDYMDELLSQVSVRDLMTDKFNNVWVSTDNNGLARISGLRNIYKTPPQPDIGGILSIAESRMGLIYSGHRGLMHPQGDVVLPGVKVWDSVMDISGAIWAATELGLYRVDDKTGAQAFASIGSVISAPGRCVCFYKSDLYVGTLRGLATVTESGVKEITMPNSESLGYVYSLHIGPVGHLWIATLGNGLWRWDGQALFKVQGGSIPEKCNVYAVTHSKTFEVFVAHDGYISKIMPNEVPRLLADSGEAVAAWSLHCPGNSRLFAGTSKGLLIYETETGQLLKRLTDCEDNWEFTTSRSINSYDGQIICGLASGLKYIDIDRLEGIVDRPVLRASMLKWYQGEPQLTGGVYQIPQGKWRVCVNVNMHWYYDEGDCEMQYLLEGFDQSWSEPHPVETITYTSLPAGDYVLKARVLSPVAGYGADSVLARIRVIPD